MAAPTAEELTVLEKFREAISDFELNEKQNTDMALMSWLRAREMNIPKAKEMLKTNLAYRKQHDIDNILQWEPPPHIKKNYPYEICGKCNEGCPVVVATFGKWDIRTAVEAGEGPTWLLYIDKAFEEIRATMDKFNAVTHPPGKEVSVPPITQTVFIVDFEGFGMRQLTSIHSVQTILEFVSRYEANYPEILKVAYLINVPRIFSIFFAIVKPALSPRTISKLEIQGSRSKWEPLVLKQIPQDQLPPKFGGTNTGICKFLARRSSSVSSAPVTDKDGMFVITIPAGKEFTLEYEVVLENTILTWNFKSQGHDIGFSILHNFTEDVLPYKKVEKQEGNILCKKTGTYTLVFDNKYSHFRKKSIHYSISMTDASDTTSLMEENGKK